MLKKIILYVSLFFLSINLVSAKEEIIVKLYDCVDGDTAKFVYNDEVITARFLAIDTPETKHPKKGTEPYGKEASNYTCSELSKAKKITLEYDNNSDKFDKYNRFLVWVFVDEKLLQEKLINKGYARVAYLYGEYKYTDLLKEKEKFSKEERIGIWSLETKDTNTIKEENICYIVAFIIIIILCILSRRIRNKVKSRIKVIINKTLKKALK